MTPKSGKVEPVKDVPFAEHLDTKEILVCRHLHHNSNQLQLLNKHKQISQLRQLISVVVNKVRLLHLNQLCQQQQISQPKILHANRVKCLKQPKILHANRLKCLNHQQQPHSEKNCHLGGDQSRSHEEIMEHLFYFGKSICSGFFLTNSVLLSYNVVVLFWKQLAFVLLFTYSGLLKNNIMY